jgi:predicted alpha-1,2-mannosidase
VQLSPDTRTDQSWDGCSGYHYSDSLIYGFSHTHLSGTGVPDLCDVLLLPVSGRIKPSDLGSKRLYAHFSHQNEKASPGFYQVHLDDGNIDVELTVTPRTGFHKYVFNGTDSMVSIVVDLLHRDEVISSAIVIINDSTIIGFRQSKGWAKNQMIAFQIRFSQPFTECTNVSGRFPVSKEPLTGSNTRVSFGFRNNGPVYVKVALSPASMLGTGRNMDAENRDWDFEKVKRQAHDAWQKELGRIEVAGGTKDERTVFYTALYHCFLVPNIAMDVDSVYRGRDDSPHRAENYNYYSVFSLWDTFRAWHPMMTILHRDMTEDFIKTFMAQYKEGGLLPVWELSSNETECMIGYHSASVIADAVVKGIGSFDKYQLLEAMKKSAESPYRYGLGAYMDHGYIGVDDEHESVSKTLEYAYDDWCIAQMARQAGSKVSVKQYLQRSQYWKNVFDPQTGFARPRKNGNWLSPFDPKEVSNNYTEGNAWQYTFFVPQDINGLIAKMGGREKFGQKLDELFTTGSQTTGRNQADITGMIGQYAHGNEPSHHICYLFNYIGKPYKTQQMVYHVMTEQYHNDPDGLAGNEDCGQMSAWFVLSSMGFYPVTPGKSEFQLGIPLFSSIKIHLENGKTFTVTNQNQAGGILPVDAFISGSPNVTRVISYDDIMQGKTLAFKKSRKPLVEAIPVIEKDTFVLVPLIEASEVFKNNINVSLHSDQKNVSIYYDVDGRDSLPGTLYKAPFMLDHTATVRAYAKDSRGNKSFISTAILHKMQHPNWSVSLKNSYSSQYTAGGAEGLIDGISGDENWRKGYWQGYQGTDFEAVIDMGNVTWFDTLSAGFLQDSRSWILMPKQVVFSFSDDGILYRDSDVVQNTIPDQDFTSQVKNFEAVPGYHVHARYVKVKAVNYGKLPTWHPGAGDDAFIFIDEIEIR